MFSELCGFKARELSALPKTAKYALEIKNHLIVASLVFCAYSAYFLIQLITDSFITAFVFFIFTATILYYLQSLIVSASGMECEKSYSEVNTWRPAKLRFYIFIVIALIFSQPLLLALYSEVYEDEINQSIEENKYLRLGFLEKTLKEKEDNLAAQLNNQHEILQRLTGISSININDSTLINANIDLLNNANNTSRRKALLIGNQAYPSAPLFNPKKDAQDMANALKEIGFSTVLVTDATKSSMEIAINNYIDSIQSGDISYFYYSGHGMQRNGQNHMIPVDFSGNNSIGINLILDAISTKGPTANVITIDACRSFTEGDNGGLASLEAGSSATYISLAAKPGQTASDGKPNTNGVYTGSILKHIKEPIDIDAIFRKVTNEVTTITNNKQEPWVNHSLRAPLILAAPQYKPNSPLKNTLKIPPVQTKIRRISKPQFLERGVTVEEDVSSITPLSSIDLIDASYSNQIRYCEQKASLLTLNESKSFLINCNQKILFDLEDKLANQKIATQNAINQFNDDMLHTNLLAYTLVTDLYYLRKSPVFLVLGTLVITGLLLIGFLMRELKFIEMNLYEQLLNYHQRNFISEKYRDAKNITKFFPLTPDEVLRNSASSPYQYRDFEDSKIDESSDFSELFAQLNKKRIGESL